jgi:hypothetical protein
MTNILWGSGLVLEVLREKRMSQFVIRLSMLTMCATVLIAVPAVTPAEAGGKHMHAKKHARYWRPHDGGTWPVGPAQPVRRSYSGDVCPGIGRSFDCKIWPPPYEDDPDRKTSRF